MDLAKTLRSAIDASGKSRYAIAKAAEVQESAVNRLMAGKDLRLGVAGKLLSALGLEVRRKK